MDKELEHLTPEKRKKRLPPSWKQWERSYLLWERTIRYIVALLQYRRPDFDGYTLEQQLDLVDKHRKGINEFLKKQREYMTLLEYGTPQQTKRPPERARDQVKAAVLKDVEELSLKEIANRLGVTVDEERYKVDSKIPAVTRLIEEGRKLLSKILSSEGGWQKRAEKGNSRQLISGIPSSRKLGFRQCRFSETRRLLRYHEGGQGPPEASEYIPQLLGAPRQGGAPQ